MSLCRWPGNLTFVNAYKHVKSELHQNLLLVLKVSRFRKRSSDRIKNRLEDTPFDKGTW